MRRQMSATRSTRALVFDSGNSGTSPEMSRASRASFRPSVVMARALSSRGSTFCERIRS